MAEPLWLVSVHDLMPATMPAVREVVSVLDRHAVRPLTLLVVPGFDWNEADLQWLRHRADMGDALAGHGWRHQAGPVRNFYDRLHRVVFSRGVAEHLALEPDEIIALMQRCHRWFNEVSLPVPQIYVPPAWAMGSVDFEALSNEAPFELYETLAGFYDARSGKAMRVPLLGFEADNRWRAASLRLSNAVNLALARVTGKLRVSIHPQDLQLHLQRDLLRLLQRPRFCGAYI